MIPHWWFSAKSGSNPQSCQLSIFAFKLDQQWIITKYHEWCCCLLRDSFLELSEPKTRVLRNSQGRFFSFMHWRLQLGESEFLKYRHFSKFKTRCLFINLFFYLPNQNTLSRIMFCLILYGRLMAFSNLSLYLSDLLHPKWSISQK